MRHILQVMVENKFGVLARIASLFSARGYNIDSLAVGETQEPTISSMTIVVNAEDERILEQIKKQLHKLIDVITVVDFTRRDYVDRELVLLKVEGDKKIKTALRGLSAAYPVKIIEAGEGIFILEICADHNTLDDIFKALKKLNIKELVRTGKIVLNK